MARGPKSHKADGTKKKRWTPEQRAARGLGPRRGGGRRRDDQFERRDWSSNEDRRGRGSKPRRDDWSPVAEDRRGRVSKPRRDDRWSRDDDRRRDDSRRDDRRDNRGWDDRPRRDRWDDRRGDRGYVRKERGWEPRRDDRRGDWSSGEGRRGRGSEGWSPVAEERRGRVSKPRRDDRGWEDRSRRDDRRGGWSSGEGRRGRGSEGWSPAAEERRSRGSKPRWEDRRRDDRWDDRPRRDFRDYEETLAPSEDQMAWEETRIEGIEGVVNGFSELGVADEMVGVLAAQGITQPFEIQVATIRDGIAGRDVLGRAKTGSGKTLAFGLALLTRLAETPGAGTRAVILSPTRELALQIADNLAPLASAVGLNTVLVAGGMSYNPQIKAFERGVEVVVATPGRLIDLMEQGAADLSNVEITVLDEADHMAEMGFTDEVTAILDATPEGGQRMLFSATLDAAVDRIRRKYMDDPVVHEIDPGHADVKSMTHLELLTKPHQKIELTARLAARAGRTVVFARTQKGSDRIAAQLREAGIMAGALHGGLTQGARARILAAFKGGDVPVLVATDVAARGIHVDDVSLVLQVDPPRDSKDYLHRAGRTARAGAAGTVATITLPHQKRQMMRILKEAGVNAQHMYVDDLSDVDELTGAQEPNNEPIAESDYLALIAPKQVRRNGGKKFGGKKYGGKSFGRDKPFKRGGRRY